MKHPAKNLTVILFLCFCSLVLSAQEKNQAYYNRHEKEIIPDATEEFKKGNYERTIELCKWHYIIVGDNAADSLREMAERCSQLTSEIRSLKDEAEDKIKNARLLTLTLLSINSGDLSAKEFLQWSERTLSDTLSTPFVSYTSLQDTQPSVDGMVDLGLSVKWATCNLGASRPEEMGDYYAWGETTPKAEQVEGTLSWEDYKWCNGSYNSLTRYCTNSDFGYIVDRITVLMPEDDAVHVNLGGKRRTPTEREIDELIKKCTWQWTQSSGVDGYRITSRVNGNSIFLPVTDSRGFYWTSSLSDGRPYSAKTLVLRPDSYATAPYARCNGFVIRPVLGK